MSHVSEICLHDVFDAHVDVTRLTDSGRYTADVKINCKKCGIPFRFLGMTTGLDLNGVAVSVDGEEARLAIAPRSEVISMVDGALQGFTVRRIK